jgi:hypothetical protein
MADTTSPTLARRLARPEPLFQPGRQGLWAGESPIVADGVLGNLYADALEQVHDAIQALLGARKASREYVERDLTAAEADLLGAVRKVTDLRQRIALAVPSKFGEVE